MANGVVPVFYINVAARTDRRNFMEAQFAELALPANRIEAVLPSQIPADVIAMARRPDGTFRITPGEIACTLSHFAAWRHAISIGADACVVLEDDGLISSSFPRFLRELGPSLPSGVDLLKLETFRQPVRLGRAAIAMGGVEARRLTSAHYGTCGYVVSARLAGHVLATASLVPLTMDDRLFARHGGILPVHRVFQANPAQVIQLFRQEKVSQDALARSDLADVRDGKVLDRYRTPRWRRIQDNLATGWQELKSFGSDVFNTRRLVPFADDGVAN